MRIRTERLLLRDFEDEDLKTVLAYRERGQQKQPWLGPRGQSVEWLTGEAEEVSTGGKREEIRLGFLLEEENQLIGACRIRRTGAEESEAELLLDFDRHYLREGHATEAVLGVVRLGFEELRLHRLLSWCVSRDVATARVLKRVGMRVDDVLPRSLWIQGKWWDTLVYSIQKAEWAAQSVERATHALSNKRRS